MSGEFKSGNNFGTMVFSTEAMREFLSGSVFAKLNDSISKGVDVDKDTAEAVASAMRAWATIKGASHYRYWFKTIIGKSAEKRDAFFYSGTEVTGIDSFGGDSLVNKLSEFESKAIGNESRDSFESRGVATWDPLSPAFIYNKILCIPTTFVSYKGDALDEKTPLIRSSKLLNRAATDVCHFFDKNIQHVSSVLGWEQEFFLLRKRDLINRPDLKYCGRLLAGDAISLDRWNYGYTQPSIPETINKLLNQFEKEALEIGIPLKTIHNERGPLQFEFANLPEEANLSNDHNLIAMDLLMKTASKFEYQVVYHEKPFSNINGSGKHTNWSLSTDTGVNLFAPGTNPKSNLQFLVFVVNALKAILSNMELIQSLTFGYGNDFRLGKNEAPPFDLDVFLGDEMIRILEFVVEGVKDGDLSPDEKTELKLQIGKIPRVLLDNTDKSRTSPIAFTGTKFEYRSVGASQECAKAITVLNTVMAHELIIFKEKVEKCIDKGEKKDMAIFQQLKSSILFCQKSLNALSSASKQVAKSRNLQNVPSVNGIDTLYNSSFSKVLLDNGVYSSSEMETRNFIYRREFCDNVKKELEMINYLYHSFVFPGMNNFINSLELGNKVLNIDEELKEMVKRFDLVRATFQKVKLECEKTKGNNEIKNQEISIMKGLIEEFKFNMNELISVINENALGMTSCRHLLSPL